MVVVLAVAGLNAAVTPLGSPEAERLTLPLKPFWPLTLIVLLALLACGTLRLAGEAERLKLGTTAVSPICAVLVKLPEVPVIVSG